MYLVRRHLSAAVIVLRATQEALQGVSAASVDLASARFLDELRVRGAYGFPRRTVNPHQGELHARRMSWPLPSVPVGRGDHREKRVVIVHRPR